MGTGIQQTHLAETPKGPILLFSFPYIIDSLRCASKPTRSNGHQLKRSESKQSFTSLDADAGD